jgi:hypothetical protein
MIIPDGDVGSVGDKRDTEECPLGDKEVRARVRIRARARVGSVS